LATGPKPDPVSKTIKREERGLRQTEEKNE
jgi:hypothetical protein